jgi:hypothetical protein
MCTEEDAYLEKNRRSDLIEREKKGSEAESQQLDALSPGMTWCQAVADLDHF